MKKCNTKIQDALDDIKNKYNTIDRPWIIGYSGGKDSTCVLQLIWQAISELNKADRRQKIFILSSDTLVETPIISDYLTHTIKIMNKTAEAKALPISAHSVTPDIRKTFWVNLIGRGYPAPRSKFRWCTDRLKIEPANKFILQVVSQYGEAVMVLGARKSESSSRAQVLKKKQSDKYYTAGAELPRHSTLTNAYVYTPIAEWTTDEVWEYLLLNANTPWGTTNRDLAAMYKEASDGECPLVVEKNTSSCGNSRFGCWVCTVVEKNKSLENIVDKGHDWLEPLLNYRNMLMETTDPSKKAKFRSYKRRTGLVKQMTAEVNGEIKLIRGPYYFDYRKMFLQELLKAQKAISAKMGDKIKLITDQELREIRKIWITEESDWEDSLPRIYREVLGKDIRWDIDDASSFGSEEMKLLDNICNELQVPVELVTKLIDKEREFNAGGRRSTLNKELDNILKEEWRSEQEILTRLIETRNDSN